MASDILVVLNPRDIPECLSSIEELPIRKVFLRGWSERAIADRAWPSLDKLDYDFLYVVSDDVIVRPTALEAVRDLAVLNHAVTGYSQRSHTEWTVNLTNAPLTGGFPHPDAYSFREFQEVVAWPEPFLPTWFTGMSLTGMTRELWDRFPFDCFQDPGYASDFHLSKRLQDAGVPIVAAREGFLYHYRTGWENTNHPDDQDPIVGREEFVIA